MKLKIEIEQVAGGYSYAVNQEGENIAEGFVPVRHNVSGGGGGPGDARGLVGGGGGSGATCFTEAEIQSGIAIKGYSKDANEALEEAYRRASAWLSQTKKDRPGHL